MFVSQNYTVRVQDPATGHSVEVIIQNATKVNQCLKGILRDIKTWQGTRIGRKWPRWEPFQNTPMHTLNFEVIQKFTVA